MASCNVEELSDRYPGRLNLRVYESQLFQFTITVYADLARTTPFDLTGYAGTADIIRTDTGAVVASFTVTVVAPATNGEVLLELSAADTEALPTGDAAPTMMYDIFFDNSSTGDRFCPVEGAVIVTRRWTAP